MGRRREGAPAATSCAVHGVLAPFQAANKIIRHPHTHARPSKLSMRLARQQGSERKKKKPRPPKKATKSQVMHMKRGQTKQKWNFFSSLFFFSSGGLADAGQALMPRQAAGSPPPHGRGQMAGDGHPWPPRQFCCTPRPGASRTGLHDLCSAAVK